MKNEFGVGRARHSVGAVLGGRGLAALPSFRNLVMLSGDFDFWRAIPLPAGL
jgi:hypothetical protein